MVTRYLALIGVAVLICSCDHFPGPYMGNGYGMDVDVTVTYSDGSATTDRWPPCFAALIGNDGLAVTSVAIRRDGRVLRELDGSAIRTMLEREKDIHQDTEWVFSADGIMMVIGKNAGPCGNRPRPDRPIPVDPAASR